MKSTEGDIKKLRVGILGNSDIARRKFLPALQASKYATLGGIGSNCTPVRLTEIPEIDHGDYEWLISRDLDIVYISLPNHLHELWAIRALESGKHVICEKPLGLSSESVERMIRCAERKGLLLYENLMFLHHPQHAIAKKILESGKIGRLKSLRTVFGFPALPVGNFRLDPALGGGAFNDLARYPLGTAVHFLNGDLSGFSGIAQNRCGLNLSMHGTAVGRESGIFTFSISFGQQYESYYEIVGETGKIRVDRAYTTPADFQNVVRLFEGGEEKLYPAPVADHFLLALDHVCTLLNGCGYFNEIHDRSRKIACLAEEMKKRCMDVEI